MDCIDRNSEISGYTVRYGAVGGTAVNASVSGTNHRTYTAVRLSPSTNYSIEVAAVNSDGGVGPFSSPIFVRTPDLTSKFILSNCAAVFGKEKVYHAACFRMRNIT